MRRYNFYKMLHPDGYIFIAIFFIISLILYSLNSTLGLLGLIATGFCAFFFRNPTRIVPCKPGLVLSPADGVIQSIKEVDALKEFAEEFEADAKMLRVSIFLNILNVHVTRIPLQGKIVRLHYNPGKFFNASLDKSSIHNERQSILIDNDESKIILVQIAGLIARRIVCDLEENTDVSTGDIFGIIRFGSRVDVYLPKESNILVSVGQTTIAGETVISDFSRKETQKINFVKK